jgi:hypothetical protein
MNREQQKMKAGIYAAARVAELKRLAAETSRAYREEELLAAARVHAEA